MSEIALYEKEPHPKTIERLARTPVRPCGNPIELDRRRHAADRSRCRSYWLKSKPEQGVPVLPRYPPSPRP